MSAKLAKKTELPTRDSLGIDTDDTVTFANLSGANTGDETAARIAALDWTGQEVAMRSSIGAVGSALELGLDQVDNTADADKPVSSAQQTAIDERLMANVGLVTLSATGTTVISSVHDGMLLNVTAATHTLNFSSATGMNRVFVIGNGTSVITLTGVVDSNGNTVSTVYAPDGLVVVERVNSVWRIISAARPEVNPTRQTELFSLASRIHSGSITSSGSNIVESTGLGFFQLDKSNGTSLSAGEFRAGLIGNPFGERFYTTFPHEMFWIVACELYNDGYTAFLGFQTTSANRAGLGSTTETSTAEGWGVQFYRVGGVNRMRLIRKATAGSVTEYGTANVSNSTGNLAVWVKLNTDGSMELRRVVLPLNINELRRPITANETLAAVDFTDNPLVSCGVHLAGNAGGYTETAKLKLFRSTLFI